MHGSPDGPMLNATPVMLFPQSPSDLDEAESFAQRWGAFTADHPTAQSVPLLVAAPPGSTTLPAAWLRTRMNNIE